MNRVSLKLNPYQEFNTISLDGENLSVYSELNNFMKEPFLKWADHFFDAVEKELNDEFDLCVRSQNFEYLFLNALANTFPDCLSIEREPFDLDYSMEERLDFLHRVTVDFPIDLEKDPIPVYLEKGVFIGLSEGFRMVSDPREAFLILTVSDASLQQYYQMEGDKIILWIGTDKELERNGSCFLWKVEADEVMNLLQAIKYRFYDIPYLKQAFKVLGGFQDQMNAEQKKSLALMMATDPYVAIQDIPDFETGETYRPLFEIIPSTAAMPHIRMRVINESVIKQGEGLELSAIKQGTTVVEFYKNEEMIPFHRQEVTVHEDRSLQRINLTLASPTMGVDYTQTLGVEYFPPDADDISSVVFSSSNPEVVSVDSKGTLVSHRPGECKITVAGRKVASSVSIRILPQLDRVELSVEDVKCFVGDVIPVQVKTSPENVYNKEVEWWTTDKLVAVVETTASGDFRIRAAGIGQCTLTCRAKEGNACATVEMFVDSSFNKRRKRKRMAFFS